MLTRADKEKIVSGLKQDFERANAFFVTNLVGIPANDAVEVRKNVRNAQGKLVVTRNNFFFLAAKGTPYEKLLTGLKGPHALAFAFGEAPEVAKALHDAGEDLELIELQTGFFDNREIGREEIVALAKLPSRDQMLSTLLATFNAPISALARVLNAVAEQKVETEQPAV